MRNLLKVQILLAALVLAGCTRYETLTTPQGTVTKAVAYPQYEPVRTKRQIVLSLADQDRFRRYYRANHSWPLSEDGFVAASDTNYRLVVGLHRQGFRNLEFVSRGPDTLRVDFIFQTAGNLVLDKGLSLNDLGRGIAGNFLFVADPVSGISFRQELTKKNKK